MQTGVSSTRQLTFTSEKNETSPRWAPDGSVFFFLSNREAPENAASRNQLYVMRPDGGEARRLTDTREGVSDYAISRDGRWLAYRSGKSGEEQLYRLPLADDRDCHRGTDHQAPDRCAVVAMGPRQPAHLFRDAGSHRRGREGAARQEIHGEHPQCGNAGRRACGRSTSSRSPPSASPTVAPTRWTTSRSPTTASGSGSADSPPTATSAASPPKTFTATSTWSKPPPARSSG